MDTDRQRHIPAEACRKEIFVIVTKANVVQALRRRGQDSRADWVDRTLPDEVDTDRNAGLLATLRLSLADLVENSESNSTSS
jgi:hypothetical protein